MLLRNFKRLAKVMVTPLPSFASDIRTTTSYIFVHLYKYCSVCCRTYPLPLSPRAVDPTLAGLIGVVAGLRKGGAVSVEDHPKIGAIAG